MEFLKLNQTATETTKMEQEDESTDEKGIHKFWISVLRNNEVITKEAKHQIIDLLIDHCDDPDKRTRKFACFAIGNAAYHNDLLYEELRRSIPQLASLLLSAEEDKTKANAAGALSNLVRNSDKLCGDIINKGAMHVGLEGEL